jgi:hypothetical protein
MAGRAANSARTMLRDKIEGGDPVVPVIQHCHEIVIVARTKRIKTRQNGLNRPIWNPLQRGVK